MLDIVVAALSMVLVVSGILKVRDPEATTPMLRAIRLPASRPVVYAVAAAEILVGSITLVIGGPLATAVLAALYAVFAVVSLVLLRADGEVPCGCFGQRSATMSPVHVAVNAVAAVAAGTAAALGAESLIGAADRSAAVVAIALAAAALLAAVVVALLTGVADRLGADRSSSPSALALADGPVASPAAGRGGGSGAATLAPVVGLTPAGEPVEVAVAGTGHVTLVAFLTSGCTTCSRFWDTFAIAGGVTLPGTGTELIIVTRGDDQENPNRVRDLAPAGHVVVRSSAAWRDYGVTAGPYFVLADGRRDVILGEGAATAWDDVVTLTRQAIGSAGVAE